MSRYETDIREIDQFAARLRTLGFEPRLDEVDRDCPMSLYARGKCLLRLGFLPGANQVVATGLAIPGEDVPQFSAIEGRVQRILNFPDNVLAFQWAFRRAWIPTVSLRIDTRQYSEYPGIELGAVLFVGASLEGAEVSIITDDCLVLEFHTDKYNYGELASWWLKGREVINRELERGWYYLSS